MMYSRALTPIYLHKCDLIFFNKEKQQNFNVATSSLINLHQPHVHVIDEGDRNMKKSILRKSNEFELMLVSPQMLERLKQVTKFNQSMGKKKSCLDPKTH